jgi:3-phosphoshikimate 1-carboxyvinyltransferase
MSASSPPPFPLPPLLCVVGPTASGKTALAARLAARLNAEVISVDASQVYEGLDVGTGKARGAELGGVPHHLLDVVSPREPFDAARFVELATRAVLELAARGRRAVLCGGTGLYFKALLYGLCEAPPVDAGVRARLKARIEAGEVEALHAELAAVDPESASRLMPRDKQRIERALGVFLTTGRPLSASHEAHGFSALRAPVLMWGLDPAREVLNERIEGRVRGMWEGGFLEEVVGLREAGLSGALQSMGAIGYRLASRHLDGELLRGEAIEQMVFATRQYARRQRRYFDHQLPTEWLPPSFDPRADDLEGLVARAEAFFREAPQSQGEGLAPRPVEPHLWGDKSIGHRAFMLAALTEPAEGPSRVSNVGGGADLASTRGALRALGVAVEPEGGAGGAGAWRVSGVGLRGLAGLRAPEAPIDCGNSGTTIRLLSGLLSGAPFEVTLDGDDSLRRRPMRRLARALEPFGRALEVGPQGGAPVRVGGARLSPPPDVASEIASSVALNNALSDQAPQAPIEVDTQLASAQVKSAALLAGLTAGRACAVRERALSRDHTERALGSLGVRVERDPHDPLRVTLTPPESLPRFDVRVPGDPSSAAFWVAVSAFSPPSAPPILLRGALLNPTRLGFVRVARAMGVEVEVRPSGEVFGEPVGDLCLRGAPRGLRAAQVPPSLALDALDELPLLALLASVAEGRTVIEGAEELRVKESDRVQAMADLLNALGADVTPTPGGWVIEGVSGLRGGRVRSEGDHRVALCGRLAGLKASGPVEVEGAESAGVSYPEFEADVSRYLSSFTHTHTHTH